MQTKLHRYILTLLTALFFTTGVQAQKLAINTDLAMDAMMLPNLGMEITCGEKNTFSFNVIGGYKPWWSKEGHAFGMQPEYRWYFSSRPMNRWFAGIGGLIGYYDLTISSKVYNGLTYGAGLTFGYVWKLSSRLNLDFHGGFGLIGYNRKEYYVGDNYDVDYTVGDEVKTNATGTYLLPTRVGISLTYIIK